MFSGGPGDRAKLQPVNQRGFTISAGVPLLVTAGLIKLAELVVGGDTGLLHLAVAMGKRVVMLMGSAGPGSCHPFGHPEWAVVPPPGKPVAAVMPEAVNQACTAAVAEQRLTAGSNRR